MEPKETHEQHAERIRRALRDAKDSGRDVAAIAQAADVTPAALYDFIADGSTVRPYRRTLAQYERALSRLDGTLPNHSGDAPDGAVKSLDQIHLMVGRLPVAVRNADGSVTLPPETYGFVLSQLLTVATMSGGVVEQLAAASKSARAMGEAMGDTLHAIGGTAERVTSGVNGIARIGMFPAPAGQELPELPSMPVTRLTEPETATQRKKRTG